MWITQTYLGTVEPDAGLFVYYLFEDYQPAQKRFTDAVQRELENLGDVYGETVSLLMPNALYAGQIEAEVREIRPLWGELKGKLPGLFLSPRPLVEVEGMDDRCFYIPFDEARDPKAVASAIQSMRGVIDSKLDVILAPPQRRSFAGRLLDAIEFKPGIWGFSIDLKALARR